MPSQCHFFVHGLNINYVTRQKGHLDIELSLLREFYLALYKNIHGTYMWPALVNREQVARQMFLFLATLAVQYNYMTNIDPIPYAFTHNITHMHSCSAFMQWLLL